MVGCGGGSVAFVRLAVAAASIVGGVLLAVVAEWPGGFAAAFLASVVAGDALAHRRSVGGSPIPSLLLDLTLTGGPTGLEPNANLRRPAHPVSQEFQLR